jgi:TIR domain
VTDTPTTLPAPRAPKASFASRLFGYDAFISFALGGPPRGSQSYASDLARRLRERDLSVFFSEDEAAPGEPLSDTLRRARLRSKLLVVIVNRGTLAVPNWVRTEVETFRSNCPGRPVIPICLDGSFRDEALCDSAQAWLQHGGNIWLDEQPTLPPVAWRPMTSLLGC